MSILQQRNMLGKRNTAHRRMHASSIAGSLGDYEAPSEGGSSLSTSEYRDIAFQPSFQTQTLSPGMNALLSDSLFHASNDYSRREQDNFSLWASYPSPSSTQKGPTDTDDETEPEASHDPRADPPASPISSTTSMSTSSGHATRLNGWFRSSVPSYDERDPDGTFTDRPGTRMPSLYRRKVHSDTPAPQRWPMSSPGVPGNQYQRQTPRPYRHSASPVPPSSTRLIFPRTTPFFPVRPLIVPGQDGLESQISSDDDHGEYSVEAAEIIQSSIVTTKTETQRHIGKSSLKDSRDLRMSSSFLGLFDGLQKSTDCDDVVPSVARSHCASMSSSGESMTLPSAFMRNTRLSGKDRGSVFAGRAKNRLKRLKGGPLPPRPTNDRSGVIRFDNAGASRLPGTQIPALFSQPKRTIHITPKRIWSSMMWMWGLGLTFIIVRSLLWSSANGYLVQGTSPGMMVPDLIKVAGLARSFEPLIHFSENGVRQIGELEDSGVAVWDLGESVRQTNMTSGPIIVAELDALGESLNLLALEMTRFYTSVDGDMDNILIVMDWARRELGQVVLEPAPSPVGRVYDKIVDLLADSGIIESEHDLSVDVITYPVDPDSDMAPRKKRPRSFLSTLARMSSSYRTRATLQVTFLELVGALEEAIAHELHASITLFSLFERVDRQFNNLQRLVAREQAGQERAEIDTLESLWTRLTGGNIATLRKFQTNRRLLGSLRDCTKRNKAFLSTHNHRLLALRTGLEALRKRLVRPLVRGGQAEVEDDEATNLLEAGASLILAMSPSSTSSAGLAGVPDQIRGIEAAHDHLLRVREGQRSRVLRLVYGLDESAPVDNLPDPGRRLLRSGSGMH